MNFRSDTMDHKSSPSVFTSVINGNGRTFSSRNTRNWTHVNYSRANCRSFRFSATHIILKASGSFLIT